MFFGANLVPKIVLNLFSFLERFTIRMLSH
jgi:hypothetical protein